MKKEIGPGVEIGQINEREIGEGKLPGTNLSGTRNEVYTLVPNKNGKNSIFPEQPEVMAELAVGTQELIAKQKQKEKAEQDKENNLVTDNLLLNINCLAVELDEISRTHEKDAETLDPRTKIQREINTKTMEHERLQNLSDYLTNKIKNEKFDASVNPDEKEDDGDTLFTIQNLLLKVNGEIDVLKTLQRKNLFNPIRTLAKKAKEQL